MSHQAHPSVTRRRLLLAAAWAAAATPATALAQAHIENSPEAGGGWAPTRQSPAPSPVVAEQPPTVAESDWRRHLLAGERSIVMGRVGDGRKQRVRYVHADGSVDREGYGRACYMLRDVTAEKVVAMDPRLLDVMCGIQRWMEFNGRSAEITLLSGFRSHATNGATEGAALNSMHLYGRAADIHIEGASSALVGAMVKVFNVGGTGVYLNRGFVHVDTGRSRTWVSSARRKG